MNYKRSIRYLESLHSRGIQLGLDRVEELFHKIGDPQKSFHSIHIAGTNGKGSVAAMLSSILYQAGYKVGLYTSPHLVEYTERVRINEKDISKSKYSDALETVRKGLKRLKGVKLTEFEVLTAAAFLLFKQEKVDIAVVEVGLGGRLDATNVIHPELSIITNIGLDHTDLLGHTLQKIAKEKAGIIKKGVPLLTGEKKVWKLLRYICNKRGARFIRAGHFRAGNVPLQGAHQVENARIALAAVKILNRSGFKISASQARAGLKHTRWPGRLQIISKKPLIILDGAHNPAGAHELNRYLGRTEKKFTMIIGMQRNKDIKKFIGEIKPNTKRFIVVSSTHPNAAPADLVIRKAGLKNASKGRDLRSALRSALSYGDPIGISGSLYLVGDVLSQKLFDL